MSEEMFRSILGEALERELAEYDNVPEHKFSLRHRLAMKRILSVANSAPKTNTALRKSGQKRSLKRSLIIAAVLVFLAVIVGAVVVFRSKDFGGTVYHDYTQMFAVNIEGSPKTIEYKYALDYVPEGFEIVDTDSSPTDVYTVYKNKLTKQTIVLRQWVKEIFDSHYNTEHHPLEEVIINGNMGLCIDFSNDTLNHSLVAWDNGDYIIEIVADLDKESTLNLCKVHKI